MGTTQLEVLVGTSAVSSATRIILDLQESGQVGLMLVTKNDPHLTPLAKLRTLHFLNHRSVDMRFIL